MRLISFIIIIIQFTTKALPQDVELEVSELQIYNIIKHDRNEIASHDDEGPYFRFKCIIVNNSNEAITLYPAEAKYLLKYTYESDLYVSEMFPLAFMDHLTFKLAPKDTINIVLSDNILLGTPMFSVEKKDYKLELLKILSTIAIVYKDRNNYFSTCKIRRTSLH